METLSVVLRPLTEAELSLLAKELMKFFSPMNNKTMREALSLPTYEKVMQPLSVFNFIKYLEKFEIFNNAMGYWGHIMSLAHKLVDQGMLIPAGTASGAPGLNACYYFMNFLTSLQDSTDYWLASILGERYLRALLSDYIVRVEGENCDGIPGTGSGVLIATDTVLTCAHNIRDMKIESCWIGENKLAIKSMQTHEKYDVGIIKVSPVYKDRNYPYFGPPLILDRTLTLGYPPLRGLREPALLAQSGEINAIGSEMFTGCECITISSITRPGNSGGPVFSLQGYIVGIVISSAYSTGSFAAQGCNNEDKEDEKNQQENESPFYLAISSNALREIIAELESDIAISFEDFQ